MGITYKVPSGIGISLLLLAMPGVAASSNYSHTAEASMEEVESNTAEADALVDDQLVDDIVSRYPYPLPEDVQLDGEGGEISADQAQWHDELVEYWEEFPYDEVASAYGCEIHDLEISESDQDVPTRSYGIDCETPEDSEALSATIDRIETEAAEITRSEASDVADSHD